MKKTMLLAAIALPCLAHAQNDATGAQPIIVTATRIPTPADQVPADVTVLTQADFAKRGDTTLADALATVPGVNLVQSGGPGNAASLFIHGTNSEDVLVLLDGVPVNDPSNSNGAFNFGTYTLADIERIEIVRGPMSGLYGASAIGGVVNIITKRGSGPATANISLAGGFPAQGQGSASLSGQSGAFDYALTGALDEEAGFDATPKRMTVYAGQHDPYRAKLGSAQLGYTLAPDTRVYAILRAQQTDAGFPDLGYPVYDDPNEFDYNTSLNGKLGITSILFDGRLSTEAFIAQVQDQLHYSNLLDAADPNAAQAQEYYHGYRTDMQWNNTLRLPDAGPATNADLLFGVEYSNDTVHERVNDYVGTYTGIVHASQHALAGHAGLQTTVLQRLTLSAALRDDAVSSFGNALTWRTGAVLALPEADALLKASYGTGFLAPSLYDLHGVNTDITPYGTYGYTGNPNLRAEYSNGFEIGPEFLLPAFGQENFADISVSYFQTSIRDLITFVSRPPDYTTSTEQNIGRANTSGVETNFVLNPVPWLTASVNYTYTRAVGAGRNGTALLRRPQNTGSAVLTVTPLPGLSITPQVQYVGRFDDYLYDDTGLSSGIGSSDPGTIVNLSASYRLDEQFTLFANGKNILDSRFESQNGLQIPGASVLIGIRATLQ